jgi:GxxExxY protein
MKFAGEGIEIGITLAKTQRTPREWLMTENEIGRHVIDVAVQVHRNVGPGLLETVYEVILAYELRRRGLTVERQIAMPVTYAGLTFDEGFRVDLIVEHKVIVELKCVEALNNVHKKQLLTYLRLADKKLGYLLNFGAALMKDGIVRTANRLT